jgi:hypothetical protein
VASAKDLLALQTPWDLEAIRSGIIPRGITRVLQLLEPLLLRLLRLLQKLLPPLLQKLLGLLLLDPARALES